MKQNKETVLVLVKVSNETIRTMTNLGYPKFKSKIYDILTYCIDKEDKKRICSMLTECNIEHIVE